MPFLGQIIILFILSCILSPLILNGVCFLLRKFAIIDRPHLYKAEQGRSPAPYGAGISILLTLILFLPVLYGFFDFSEILEKRLHIVLILGVILAVVSFIDDMDTIGKSRMSVPPLFRLAMQIGIGAIIGMTSIKISYISNLFGGVLNLTDYSLDIIIGNAMLTIYFIPIAITIFWYVLVFNSINFSDGIPGLTGGFSLISFVILAGLAVKLYFSDATIATQENSAFLLTLLAIVIPATFFLTRKDISRQALMGDSGTIMLAFLIATFAIVAGGKIATAISVLGIYLIDFVYVITVRIMKGINPLK